MPAAAIKFVLGVASLVVLALVAPLLLPRDPAPATEGLPWQIAIDAAGDAHVFGLTLGKSTLADARQRFGDDLAIAIVAAPGEPGTLEAYAEKASAGFVSGAFILSARADDATIRAMRQRAVRSDYMASTTRRETLHADDLARALQAPLAAISFIPAAALDEAALIQRFGAPAERIRADAGHEHLLYPDKGLDILVSARGKEVLQYVAPRDFARLRAPLTAAAR